MRVRLLRPAINDLIFARRFYDRHDRSAGDYFFSNLFSDIDSLEHRAGIHSQHFGFYRRLASRFPYAIYYKIIEGEVVVFRVLDCRRDPQAIKKELS